MEQENFIDFKITPEQAEKICIYFGKNYKELEDYEICSLLDTLIFNIVDTGEISIDF